MVAVPTSVGYGASLGGVLLQRLPRTIERGARVGDVKTVTLPTGPKEWEIVAIAYPIGE